jgi:hypothetical protein
LLQMEKIIKPRKRTLRAATLLKIAAMVCSLCCREVGTSSWLVGVSNAKNAIKVWILVPCVEC